MGAGVRKPAHEQTSQAWPVKKEGGKFDGRDGGVVVTAYIRAEITRWVSDDCPGFVECRFADRFGREWVVVEKAPVLTDAGLRSDSRYPQPVLIACEVVARRQDDAGREIVDITTEIPWAIETTDGTTSFELFAEQLQSDPNNTTTATGPIGCR